VTERIDYPIVASATNSKPIYSTSTHHSTWYLPGLLLNGSLFLTIIASTAFACARWRRRALRWWQFRVLDIFALIGIVGVLAGLYRVERDFRQWWERIVEYAQFAYRIQELPWYVAGPLLFGIGCLIYAVGWLCVRAIHAAYRRIDAMCGKRRGTRGNISAELSA
jgi:hypothetical protein